MTLGAVAQPSQSSIDSIGLNVTSLYNANYKEGRVYPTLAAGATVISGASDWVLGAFATVIPASTIGVEYHVSSVVIETCDKDAVFELVLYHGDSDTPISTVRFSVIGGYFGNTVYHLPSIKIPADDRIRAKLASSDGLANQATIKISVVYRLIA